MTLSGHDALALLQQMQQASRRSAPGLPEQTQAKPMWTGLGFRVQGQALVTPLDHVSEVLTCPPITGVPGTQPWLKGVANVRGTLLTIVDLAEYFGRKPVALDDKARLLVLNVPELHTGVLVDEVLGLRHFDEEQERRTVPEQEGAIAPHLRGAFERDHELWGVFDVHSLAESSAFKHVAA